MTADSQADADLREGKPRIGLFICGPVDRESLERLVDRFPPQVDGSLDSVVVMLDRPVIGGARLGPGPPDSLEPSAESTDIRSKLIFHRPPHTSDFGSIRKGVFEYAIRTELDYVIVMRGDGAHAPGQLPRLVDLARDGSGRAILSLPGERNEPSMLGRISRRLSNFIQNRILGLRLHDYRTSFRVYPTEALRRIPFHLNTNDRRFDSEVLLQLRALGVSIHGEPAAASHVNGPRGAGDARIADDLEACRTAIGYRLHQAHVTRNGRYLVDHDIHYTLKHSTTGSHFQVAESIDGGAAVLDLGCSTGLLARPLQEKNVRVTGVDAGPGRHLAKELAEYHQRDLELPLELPFGREFDFIVCADVIEHLRNRAQLLQGARRYLKPDGKLVISTPNVALWFYRLSLLVGRFEYGPRGVLDETHLHLYTGATFRREVERAGFHVLRTRVTALPFEVVFESTGRSRFVRALATSYHFLARFWPSMFAYQYVLEARITTLDEESTGSAAI